MWMFICKRFLWTKLGKHDFWDRFLGTPVFPKMLWKISEFTELHGGDAVFAKNKITSGQMK